MNGRDVHLSTSRVAAGGGRVRTSWEQQMIDEETGLMMRTDTDTDTDGGGQFKLVQRRSAKKRPRDGQQQQQQSENRTTPSAGSRKKAKPLVVGRKQLDTALTQNKLSAAKPLQVRKAIFYIDNLNTNVGIEDLESYVSNLGVRVINCYTTIPRRSRKQKLDEFVDKDRHAFRLCINDDDSEKLLDPENWPEDVAISRWYFRPAAAADSADLQNDERQPFKKRELGWSPAGGATVRSASGLAAAAAAAAAAADDAADDELNDVSVVDMDATIIVAGDHGGTA